MINEELTFQKFGYYSGDWALKSDKRIVCICDQCGKIRDIPKQYYRSLCQSCGIRKTFTKERGEKITKGKLGHTYSKERSIKISLATKGKPKHTLESKLKLSLFHKGKKLPKETCEKISENKLGCVYPETRNEKISLALKGKRKSEKHCENISKARLGVPNFKIRGKGHWNWKGGVTPLGTAISCLLEYSNWVLNVFRRDNYTCVDCGAKNGEGKAVWLEAHHIRGFSEIYKEFLQKHNNLDPIKDKEILIGLALEYAPFWELSNGKTLCLACHELIHSKKEKHELVP